MTLCFAAGSPYSSGLQTRLRPRLFSASQIGSSGAGQASDEGRRSAVFFISPAHWGWTDFLKLIMELCCKSLSYIPFCVNGLTSPAL